MRQQSVHPPSRPRPSPRVEIVDDRDQVWVSVREWNGKFVCDGHAVHLLYRSPFEDISLAATTLEEAVVEARTRVAEELYRLAGEIDYGNFKGECGARKYDGELDAAYVKTLGKVWQTMFEYQAANK